MLRIYNSKKFILFNTKSVTIGKCIKEIIGSNFLRNLYIENVIKKATNH